MKKIAVVLLLLTGFVPAWGQQRSRAFEEMVRQIEQAMESPLTQTEKDESVNDLVAPPKKPPAVWKFWASNTLNFSQMALSNWSAGGQGNVALNAYTDWSANMSKGRHRLDNRLQAAYGFIHAFGDRYKKSDDKLIFDSKWGFQSYDKFFVSAAFNMISQMTTGYDYPKDADPRKRSDFMAPGTFSLGLGMDYKPFPFFSVNVSPVTSKLVVVTDSLLRTRYGNRIDEPVRVNLGAQIKLDLVKKEVFNNVVISSDLTLFSNYLSVPSNIKVYWNLLVDMKVNRFLSVNFRTNMIYDDEIKITDRNGNTGPRLQIKEVLAVGLTYSFGQR